MTGGCEDIQGKVECHRHDDQYDQLGRNFSAGEVLHKKLTASVVGKHIKIPSQTIPEKQSVDERIVYKITIEKDSFVHTRRQGHIVM